MLPQTICCELPSSRALHSEAALLAIPECIQKENAKFVRGLVNGLSGPYNTKINIFRLTFSYLEVQYTLCSTATDTRGRTYHDEQSQSADRPPRCKRKLEIRNSQNNSNHHEHSDTAKQLNKEIVYNPSLLLLNGESL